MSDVAKAVKPLFDKFIDFFDIFDLSFFVSGATFIAAIAWAGLTPELARLVGYEPLGHGDWLGVGEISGVGIAMLVLASYVAGMTCFALGRFIRKWTYRFLDWIWTKVGGAPRAKRVWLFEELTQHGVLERIPGSTGFRVSDYGRQIPWLARYLVNGGEGQEPALYVRMWAEVRQRERFSPSFSLLRRYWVSAATLDGLFIAFVTWAGLLFLEDQRIHNLAPTVATLIGALFCLREAQRYGVYQREELVASLLHGYDLPDTVLSGMMSRVSQATTSPGSSLVASIEDDRELAGAQAGATVDAGVDASAEPGPSPASAPAAPRRGDDADASG